MTILALGSLSTDFSSLIWIALVLSLIALFCSLIALRRVKRHGPAESVTTATTLNSPGSLAPAFDPALVAVLSAAVAMMLDCTPPRQTGLVQSQAAPAPASASVAGFTIRKIRRV
jgi:hypothetical protein